MSDYKLKAQKRDVSGKKLEKSRKSGLIPAIIYGKGKENVNLFIERNSFNRVFNKAGETSLVDLSIEGEKESRNVLIHEIQINPVSDDIIHIDFYEVRMDVKVESEVPLKFIGESPAVKDLGGTLITNKDSVEVKCLPANIPHEIEVDISSINTFADSITAKDLKIPANVELLTDLEETIALVNPPRSEEELASLEEKVTEDVEAVGEVEKKKEKEEEEGGEEKTKEPSKAEDKKE